MKRMLVFFMLLVLFASHFETIFAFHEEEPPLEEILIRIQEIFEVRTGIWNSFLDNYDYNLGEIENRLKEHVVDPLLKEDLKTYQEISKDPTSYEKIMGLRINECTWIEGSNNSIKLYLQIDWELQGYDERTSDSVNYVVEMIKKSDTWFLRDYRVAIDK